MTFPPKNPPVPVKNGQKKPQWGHIAPFFFFFFFFKSKIPHWQSQPVFFNQRKPLLWSHFLGEPWWAGGVFFYTRHKFNCARKKNRSKIVFHTRPFGIWIGNTKKVLTFPMRRNHQNGFWVFFSLSWFGISLRAQFQEMSKHAHACLEV